MAQIKHPLELTLQLIRRDFIVRYKDSILGVLWYLLLPLVQLAILVFVFRKVIPLNIESYPAFVFTGLLPWTWFNNSLSASSVLFVSNRDLIRRPHFPPFVLVLVTVGANLVLYLISLPIAFFLMFLDHQSVSGSLIYLPLVLIIEAMLITGLGLIIATWNAFYRDVQHILGVVLPLLFYLTPVFYRSDQPHYTFHFLYDWNPIAILIRGHRAIILYGTHPRWLNLSFAFVISLILLLIGWRIYKRRIHEVIDLL